MAQTPKARSEQHADLAILLEDVRELVSPPQIHFALLEVLNDPNSESRDIAEVITVDPSLSARLLKIVNSPYYGLAKRVDTLSRAVTVIGKRDLFHLAVAVTAASTFARLPSTLVNMDTFWGHSVLTAMISRELAKVCDVLHPERLFVAGLLHDMGSLLLYHERPEIMRDLLLAAKGDEEVLYHAEIQALGFSHADIGAAALASWRLPDSLCLAVGCHHDPLAVRGVSLEPCIVHLADYVANRSDRGAFAAEHSAGTGVDEEILRALDLNTRRVIDAVEIANATFDKTLQLFLP